MSGIVGVFNLDGSLADQRLVRRLTQWLAFRGPDDQGTLNDGCVGLGHTLLGTTPEAVGERQPLTLDGTVWIVADARIDGRAALIDRLAARGRAELEGIPDAALILHAYHVWGEDCVDYLLGDFTFAIWDRRKQRLFCAHDHFGVKPFYYAHLGGQVIFSNTLNCIRLHPSVSPTLNEEAVADFLLFAVNQAPSTTFFADIQRLPPGACITFARDGVRQRRYWELQIPPVVYRRANDYVEQFRSLLRAAVEDRLRSTTVGVLMSGGIDSPTLAAIAHQALTEGGAPFDLRAHTHVSDGLLPDRERHYARLVAEAIGIPITTYSYDDCASLGWWDQTEWHTPEPELDVFLPVTRRQLQDMATYSRVGLAGWDGDAMLKTWLPAHFVGLLKGRQLGRLVGDGLRLIRSHKTLPPFGIRTRWRRWLHRQSDIPLLPGWLNPDFQARTASVERWREYYTPPSLDRGPRDDALSMMTTPVFEPLLRAYDAGVTGSLVEIREPLMDVRLVNFTLSLPPVPWCVNKTIFREAMRGHLPEPVRTRPKSPLAGNPALAYLQQSGNVIEYTASVPEWTRFVDESAFPRLDKTMDAQFIWPAIYALFFKRWLRSMYLVRVPHDTSSFSQDTMRETTPENSVSCYGPAAGNPITTSA